MNIRITLLLLCLSGQVHAQHLTSDQSSVVSYLVQKVIFPKADSGAIVLVPLSVENIKHSTPGKDVKYWSILAKYFPQATRDSLTHMVATAPWLDTMTRLEKFKINYPQGRVYNPNLYWELTKEYHFDPVYAISNIVYAENGKICIVYGYGFQVGAFTIEIKKATTGKWKNHTASWDWVE